MVPEIGVAGRGDVDGKANGNKGYDKGGEWWSGGLMSVRSQLCVPIRGGGGGGEGGSPGNGFVGIRVRQEVRDRKSEF